MALAETLGLRGYDALQLAAGREINALCIASSLPPLTFVSADKELNAAAASEGLLIKNPNDYR
jgi:predicted nucleic acid-binding protein